MSEIRVGDKFEWGVTIVTVIYVSKRYVSFELANGVLLSRSIDNFFEDYTKIEPEREKIELFLCVDSLFENCWLDKDFRKPSKAGMKWYVSDPHCQRVYPAQSMFICSDTFEVVE